MSSEETEKLQERIFSIENQIDFNEICLDVFRFQYQSLPVYREYCDLIQKDPGKITDVNDIPFLPISFFKQHRIISEGCEPQLKFSSSGTTRSGERSVHLVADQNIYKQGLLSSFEKFISPCKELKLFSLLPNYNENPESSLIYMVKELSKHSLDGKLHEFTDHEGLIKALKESNSTGERSILFGVSFALLDLAEKFNVDLQNTIILETGGMKGRRKEIVRSELHNIISKNLNPGKIVSEYGMTELLSQAYAINSEFFNCPPWMKILIRETQDPLSVADSGSGAINVIDLANLYSISFIATDDLGKLNHDGSFAVLGRFDHSDIRGCNLMYDV